MVDAIYHTTANLVTCRPGTTRQGPVYCTRSQYNTTAQGRLRRCGGLTPAQAPRIPAMTQVGFWQIEAVSATVLPSGTLKIQRNRA